MNQKVQNKNRSSPKTEAVWLSRFDLLTLYLIVATSLKGGI